MELLGSILDHLARDQGSGHAALRPLEASVPVPLVHLLADIAYGPHPRQRLDLYRPHQAQADCRLVVFLYGGCWTTGARHSYRFLAHVLGSRGFAVAIQLPPVPRCQVSRLSGRHRLRDRLAVPARGRTPNQPGDRMALLGHSAGAYNAAILALDPIYLERTRRFA